MTGSASVGVLGQWHCQLQLKHPSLPQVPRLPIVFKSVVSYLIAAQRRVYQQVACLSASPLSDAGVLVINVGGIGLLLRYFGIETNRQWTICQQKVAVY